MGSRPLAPVKIGYENTYLYLTLCPFTGEGFAAFLPKLTTEHFRWFVDKIQTWITQPSLFIADGATAHKADVFDSQKLTFVKLPPVCPELNPVERFFKEVRKGLKNRVFDTLQQAQNRLQKVVEELSENIISLTCFPYIKNTSPQI